MTMEVIAPAARSRIVDKMPAKSEIGPLTPQWIQAVIRIAKDRNSPKVESDLRDSDGKEYEVSLCRWDQITINPSIKILDGLKGRDYWVKLVETRRGYSDSADQTDLPLETGEIKIGFKEGISSRKRDKKVYTLIYGPDYSLDLDSSRVANTDDDGKEIDPKPIEDFTELLEAGEQIGVTLP